MKETNLKTIINLLDAKAEITVFKTETESIFSGNVYQLYDRENLLYKNVADIRFSDMFGVEVMLG
ncbi:MAG: hypothetical protein NC489_32165 [Ruminococcus flavefaciens]|nr:hypothetical protein [Ruminococcus flavefaciens]